MFASLFMLLGTDSVEQLLEADQDDVAAHYNATWAPVTFSQRAYYDTGHPTSSKVIFSEGQQQVLGMESFSQAGSYMIASFVSLALYFVAMIVILRFDGRRAFACFLCMILASCCVLVFSIMPAVVLERSALCGPYYIELPFEEVYIEKSDSFV